MYRLLLFVLTLLSGAAHAQSLSPLGTWTNADRRATFELYKCGNQLCGRVASLTTPNDASGKPQTDTENPDPKLRSRPRLGLVILQGFRYEGDNKWVDGKIYNPEEGKTYACYLKMKTLTEMEVKGYIGFTFVGKSQIWTRIK